MQTLAVHSLLALAVWGLVATPPASAQTADEAADPPGQFIVDGNVIPAGCNCGGLSSLISPASSWDSSHFGEPLYGPPVYGGPDYAGPMDGNVIYGEPMPGGPSHVGHGHYGPAGDGPPEPKAGRWNSQCHMLWTGRLEAFVLERDEPRDQPIVVFDNGTPFNVNPADDVPLLGTGDLELHTEVSFRAALIARRCEKISHELAYFGLYEWERTDEFVGDNNLAVPFAHALTVEFDDADQITVQYASEIHSGELNRRCHLSPTTIFLTGIRYFNLNERLHIDSIDGSFVAGMPPRVGTLNTDTDNHLIGFQLGLDYSKCCSGYGTLAGGAKAGIYSNFLNKHVSYSGSLNVFQLPRFEVFFEDNRAELAFLAEAHLEYRFHLRKHLDAFFGYRLLYVDGVALAPEQFDPLLTPFSTDTPTEHEGKVLYQGAYGGFMFYF